MTCPLVGLESLQNVWGSSSRPLYERFTSTQNAQGISPPRGTNFPVWSTGEPLSIAYYYRLCNVVFQYCVQQIQYSTVVISMVGKTVQCTV